LAERGINYSKTGKVGSRLSSARGHMLPAAEGKKTDIHRNSELCCDAAIAQAGLGAWLAKSERRRSVPQKKKVGGNTSKRCKCVPPLPGTGGFAFWSKGSVSAPGCFWFVKYARYCQKRGAHNIIRAGYEPAPTSPAPPCGAASQQVAAMATHKDDAVAQVKVSDGEDAEILKKDLADLISVGCKIDGDNNRRSQIS